MLSLDLDYLQRTQERENPASILLEPKFLTAQKLFFSIVTDLGGRVDFDIADMREVHAIAALGDIRKKKVLDIGCGSTETYVLGDTFRDRYPPFFAEMATTLGAKVTGIDIRANPNAKYDHRVLDLTKRDWSKNLEPPYDIIACFNLFNAPKSPFEHDATLCDAIMDEMRALLSPEGLLIVTLRDDLFAETSTKKEQEVAIKHYVESKNYRLRHSDGNCAWLQ